MTIQELYDWAKEHNCLDVTVAKHVNFNLYDVRTVVHSNNLIAPVEVGDPRVILD